MHSRQVTATGAGAFKFQYAKSGITGRHIRRPGPSCTTAIAPRWTMRTVGNIFKLRGRAMGGMQNNPSDQALQGEAWQEHSPQFPHSAGAAVGPVVGLTKCRCWRSLSNRCDRYFTEECWNATGESQTGRWRYGALVHPCALSCATNSKFLQAKPYLACSLSPGVLRGPTSWALASCLTGNVQQPWLKG